MTLPPQTNQYGYVQCYNPSHMKSYLMAQMRDIPDGGDKQEENSSGDTEADGYTNSSMSSELRSLCVIINGNF